MAEQDPHVCPVERAGSLDTRMRRWLQNPRRLLRPHVRAGMTVLDMGCGPGFFTLALAELVGPAGRVIAADLQDGMLRKLAAKIRGTSLQERIHLHLCPGDGLGLAERLDFALAFYVLHELPDQSRFFREVGSLLGPECSLLVVEPPLHVSGKAFAHSIQLARAAGFDRIRGPRILLGKTALLQMGAVGSASQPNAERGQA